MIYDAKRFHSIMKELDITPNQLYFCVILMASTFEEKQQLLEHYTKAYGGFSYEEIDGLEEKDYIFNYGKNKEGKATLLTIPVQEKKVVRKTVFSDAKYLEMYMVTPTFRDKLYIDKEEAAEEMLLAYPSWITIDGKRQAIKIIPDRNEFYEYYNTITNGDIIKHKLIVEMFSKYRKYVNEGKFNGMGIRKALESKLWLAIQEEVELEGVNKDNIGDI